MATETDNLPPRDANGDIAKYSLASAEVGIYAISEVGKPGPLTLQYTFDTNYLRDPIGHAAFKGLDGRHPDVRKWIGSDRRVDTIRSEVRRIVFDHVNILKSKWLSISFEDHHGKWIAAAVAEIVAQDLLAHQYKVSVVHDWVTNCSR